ncbi:hypothetical protein [Streptomyces hydrogenans]
MTSTTPSFTAFLDQPPYYWGEHGPYFHQPPQRHLCCAIHGEGLDLGNRTAAVAIHEAGHAVAGFLLGIHVDSVSLTFTEENRPCGRATKVEGSNDGIIFEHTKRKTLTFLAAGVAAHYWALRKTGDDTPERMFFAEAGGAADWAFAQRVVRDNTGEDLAPADYWRFWDVANELLTDHRVALAKVAELVIAGPVSGDDAAAACGLVNAVPIQRRTV